MLVRGIEKELWKFYLGGIFLLDGGNLRNDFDNSNLSQR